MDWGGISILSSLLLPQELQRDVLETKEAFLANSTFLDQLPQPADPSTLGLHSGQLHSLQTAAYLEKMLLAKSNEFEVRLALLPFEWCLCAFSSRPPHTAESCEAIVLFAQHLREAGG